MQELMTITPEESECLQKVKTFKDIVFYYYKYHRHTHDDFFEKVQNFACWNELTQATKNKFDQDKDIESFKYDFNDKYYKPIHQKINTIVEAMGYIFSGMNRRIFFVAGTAHGSGKSTLGILLQSLIGDQYVSNISTHQLDGRFALGGTRQSILNLCMDIPKGHLSSVVVSIIKSVSGGDTISCEQKYQAPERMISNIRFLFGSNYGISVPESENEDAFWSRMVVLPFPFTIPAHQVDPTIVEKMIDEKDRIISYCLRAMSHVLTNNCTFSPCQVADEMKRNWRHLSADSKSFELYWYENITVTGKSDDQIFTHELYNDYLQFCAERNLEAIPLNSIKPWVASNIPQNECSHKRLHKTNDNPKSGFIGVKFKNINEKGITNYDT